VSRIYARLIVILLLLFTAALLLINIRPYDDHDLRQLLLPEGCPAPCFMGIRPGVTTQDEAITLLKANKWVDKVNTETLNNMVGYISWTWSDQKPKWIQKNIQGEIRAANNLVSTITVYTDMPLGDTRLALGLPDMEIVDPERDQRGPIFLYMAFYGQKGLLIQNWQSCDVSEPFRSTVLVKIGTVSSTTSSEHFNSLNDLFHSC